MENFKNIDFNGRTFRLNKMNALTASYMLTKLMKILSPIVKHINLEDDNLDKLDLGSLNLTEMASSLLDLEEKDFRYIQDNVLKVIQEVLPGGQPFILNKYGEFEALNVSYDIELIMNLTVKGLWFNFEGFFKENLLASLTKRLNISQQNLKI